MNPKSFEETWSELVSLIPNQDMGSFEYPNNTEESVLESLRNKIPKKYGVYRLYGISRHACELIYIGMSGTIGPAKTMSAQTLQKRLTRGVEIKPKENAKRVLRKDLYPALVGENDEVLKQVVAANPRLEGARYESIRIDWVETFKDWTGIPPSLAETNLLWAYLVEHGDLPKMNKEL